MHYVLMKEKDGRKVRTGKCSVMMPVEEDQEREEEEWHWAALEGLDVVEEGEKSDDKRRSNVGPEKRR